MSPGGLVLETTRDLVGLLVLLKEDRDRLRLPFGGPQHAVLSTRFDLVAQATHQVLTTQAQEWPGARRSLSPVWSLGDTP